MALWLRDRRRTVMYLSRVELLPSAIRRAEVRARIGNAYGWHQLLWELFGDDPNRRRDFLFRWDDGARGAEESLFRAFTLSAREPLDRSGDFRVDCRRLEPVLAKGERLAFSVRVNPTVRHGADPRKNKARHDVVMDAKRRLGDDTVRPLQSEIVRSSTLAWLHRQALRSGFAFKDSEIGVEGYRQSRFRKRGAREVRLSTVDIEGVLEVEDPDRFLDVWRGGLGPAKGFGCGLLLLRRV